MRNGSNVLDHGDLETYGLKSADRGFTSRTGTLNVNLNRLKTVLNSSLSGSFGSGLSCERCALSGALEAKLACRSPRNCISVNIGDSYDSVIESGLNVFCLYLRTEKVKGESASGQSMLVIITGSVGKRKIFS